METEIERKIKCLRLDKEKNNFLANLTVIYNRWEFTTDSPTDIHEQNGVAERRNQSIMEAERALLEEKNMPKFN